MILAAILLAAIMIWKITSQCARKKRHLITGALLVVIVTTLGIGVYPVVFQKNKPSTEAKDGDIEKSGDTIFISKITPMRDENNENRCASQIAHED
ncbi:MAG: hypothetical protein KJO79_07920, partial [Verrucomicrobiae bacterium]|nr:hypothetical protein [Verrucomicrobiae bacterium]NNJ87092.1 hypothetical protein [Akkermansiaceae bacterium]